MADTDLIERATKAIDLFDAICNIHDPSVSAHDRRVRAMAKVLEAAPSPSPAPAVAEDDAETLKSRAAAVLCEAGALCGWPAPNCNAREGAEALFKAGLLALALSQPAKGEREGGGE